MNVRHNLAMYFAARDLRPAWMQFRPCWLICRLAILSAAFVVVTPATAVAETLDFESVIAPLIAKRCLECHNVRDRAGGLDLSSAAGLAAGGDSGAVIDRETGQAELIRRIVAGEMPPESRGQSQQLPEAEIALLRDWIASGAVWPKGRHLDIYERSTDVRGGMDWWSLQPIQRPSVPRIRRDAADQKVSQSHNPIDAFVQSRLASLNWHPAPPADRRVLIRRASVDLMGLPPTAAEVDAFLSDRSPDAYERLIDRLLDSPHFGERWARHWLDLVRYAETCGYERDQLKPGIWRYRDWVIAALNQDMPYDRFVIEQLAGDEVPWRNRESIIATGMLRAGTWNDEPNNPADYLYTRLEDMVHTTTTAFLGLSVKCARCHDHKFDPIRQTDYYRTASVFWAGYIGQANLGGPSKEDLGFDVFGWTDRGPIADPIRLLKKGDRNRPAEIVPPGFLSAITALDRPMEPPPKSSSTTHRRLQLGRWITDVKNPLTARVMVNRLWTHHFGRGIVSTPNNFGFKGELPSHPALLDWLAEEFVAGGWKMKRIHKLIMMSDTYRQSSQHPNEPAISQRDPQNRLLWRANRRRLDAEAIRDAMLAASGLLNRQMGGPSFIPEISDEALDGLSRKDAAWGQSSSDQRARRSIYMMIKRSQLLPMMTTFDFCDTTLPCGQRDETTVAPQALALMNNHFVHRQSEALAARILSQAKLDAASLVEAAWRSVLGRLPSDDERTAAERHVALQYERFAVVDRRQGTADDPAVDPRTLALASLCHVLFCTNEFLYVD